MVGLVVDLKDEPRVSHPPYDRGSHIQQSDMRIQPKQLDQPAHGFPFRIGIGIAIGFPRIAQVRWADRKKRDSDSDPNM